MSNKLLSRLFSKNKQPKNLIFSDNIIEELIKAILRLSKEKVGALIVIEQEVSLDEYIKSGIIIDGQITSYLLRSIFMKNAPLEDGAVIIRGDRIISATCYLPLSTNMNLSKDLGTRHRAGVGISEVSDSLTIIVSEETGNVSIAQNGKLMYNINSNFLTAKLKELQKE